MPLGIKRINEYYLINKSPRSCRNASIQQTNSENFGSFTLEKSSYKKSAAYSSKRCPLFYNRRSRSPRSQENSGSSYCNLIKRPNDRIEQYPPWRSLRNKFFEDADRDDQPVRKHGFNEHSTDQQRYKNEDSALYASRSNRCYEKSYSELRVKKKPSCCHRVSRNEIQSASILDDNYWSSPRTAVEFKERTAIAKRNDTTPMKAVTTTTTSLEPHNDGGNIEFYGMENGLNSRRDTPRSSDGLESRKNWCCDTALEASCSNVLTQSRQQRLRKDCYRLPQDSFNPVSMRSTIGHPQHLWGAGDGERDQQKNIVFSTTVPKSVRRSESLDEERHKHSMVTSVKDTAAFFEDRKRHRASRLDVREISRAELSYWYLVHDDKWETPKKQNELYHYRSAKSAKGASDSPPITFRTSWKGTGVQAAPSSTLKVAAEKALSNSDRTGFHKDEKQPGCRANQRTRKSYDDYSSNAPACEAATIEFELEEGEASSGNDGETNFKESSSRLEPNSSKSEVKKNIGAEQNIVDQAMTPDLIPDHSSLGDTERCAASANKDSGNPKTLKTSPDSSSSDTPTPRFTLSKPFQETKRRRLQSSESSSSSLERTDSASCLRPISVSRSKSLHQISIIEPCVREGSLSETLLPKVIKDANRHLLSDSVIHSEVHADKAPSNLDLFFKNAAKASSAADTSSTSMQLKETNTEKFLKTANSRSIQRNLQQKAVSVQQCGAKSDNNKLLKVKDTKYPPESRSGIAVRLSASPKSACHSPKVLPLESKDLSNGFTSLGSKAARNSITRIIGSSPVVRVARAYNSSSVKLSKEQPEVRSPPRRSISGISASSMSRVKRRVKRIVDSDSDRGESSSSPQKAGRSSNHEKKIQKIIPASPTLRPSVMKHRAGFASSSKLGSSATPTHFPHNSSVFVPLPSQLGDVAIPKKKQMTASPPPDTETMAPIVATSIETAVKVKSTIEVAHEKIEVSETMSEPSTSPGIENVLEKRHEAQLSFPYKAVGWERNLKQPREIESEKEPPLKLATEPPLEPATEPPLEPATDLPLEPAAGSCQEAATELEVELELEPGLESVMEPELEIKIPKIEQKMEPEMKSELGSRIEAEVEPSTFASLEKEAVTQRPLNEEMTEEWVSSNSGEIEVQTSTTKPLKFSRELCGLYEHLIDSGASQLLFGSQMRPRKAMLTPRSMKADSLLNGNGRTEAKYKTVNKIKRILEQPNIKSTIPKSMKLMEKKKKVMKGSLVTKGASLNKISTASEAHNSDSQLSSTRTGECHSDTAHSNSPSSYEQELLVLNMRKNCCYADKLWDIKQHTITLNNKFVQDRFLSLIPPVPIWVANCHL